MNRQYVSSIPPGAKEHVVTEYRCERMDARSSRITLRKTECRYRGKVVGTRHYEEDGTLVFETPLKNGKKHGIVYEWYDTGEMECAEPFHEGVMHGTTRQWTPEGRLMGTYRMVDGTGLDVWRTTGCGGAVHVSEVWEYRDGVLHGFNWFLNEDQVSVWVERHYWHGSPHGIHREWNLQRRLRRDSPKYFMHGERVTRQKYLRAAATDPTLPPFRIEDNLPARIFPSAICQKAGLKHSRPT